MASKPRPRPRERRTRPEPSSGNVFSDLGLSDPLRELARVKLAQRLLATAAELKRIAKELTEL